MKRLLLIAAFLLCSSRAWAVVAVAQEVVAENLGGSGTTAFTLSITPTAGSTLLVHFGATGVITGSWTCADDVDGSYGTALQDVTDAFGTRAVSFALVNNTGGARTITVTTAGSVTFYAGMVAEISGAATVSAVNASAAQAQVVGDTTADAVTSGVANVSSQPALIYGWVWDWFSHQTVAGTGFTTGTASAGHQCLSESKRVTSTGNQAATYTFTSSPNVTTTFMVAVLEAATSVSTSSIFFGGGP